MPIHMTNVQPVDAFDFRVVPTIYCDACGKKLHMDDRSTVFCWGQGEVLTTAGFAHRRCLNEAAALTKPTTGVKVPSLITFSLVAWLQALMMAASRKD
jgi:hypothetical protein